VDFFIGGGMEKIIKALLKAIPKIVVAIVRGIASGLSKAIKNIFNRGKFDLPPLEMDDAKVEESAKKISRIFTGSSEELFRVLGFEADKRGEDKSITIGRIIGAAFDQGTAKAREGFVSGAGKIKEAWLHAWNNWIEPIVDLHKKAWLWVWNEVMLPFGKKVGEWFDTAMNGMISPFMGFISRGIGSIVGAFLPVLTSAGTALTDLILGFGEILSGIGPTMGKWFKEIQGGISGVMSGIGKFMQGAISGLTFVVTELLGLFKKIPEIIGGIAEGFGSAFLGVFETLKQMGLGILKGMTDFAGGLGSLTDFTDGLNESIKGISVENIFGGGNPFQGQIDGISLKAPGGLWDKFSEMFKGLDPSNLLKKMFKVKGGGTLTVEKLLGIDVPFVKFAEGGLVPGKATVKGDSEANDKILALLSPGEFVIPRSAMQDPLVSKLIGFIQGDLPKMSIGGLVEAFIKGDTEGMKEEAQETFTIPKSVREAGSRVLSQSSQVIGDMSNHFVEQIRSGMSHLGTVFGTLLGNLWSVFGELVASKTREGGLKMIEGTVKRAGFAQGGLVTGPEGAGDVVPAMLTPGEFVMSKSAVDGLGIPNLRAMNQTGSMSGSVTNVAQDIKIVVNAAGGNLSEGFVRQTLMPTVKTELKRASLNGEFIMSERGLR
jgi:hypothetical protein